MPSKACHWRDRRSIAEAAEPERRRIHERVRIGDKIRHQPARRRSDAKPVSGKPGRYKESRKTVDAGDDGNGVWHRIDKTRPALSDNGRLEGWKDFTEAAKSGIEQVDDRFRIENPSVLKWR